jgi:hypothetical protein
MMNRIPQAFAASKVEFVAWQAFMTAGAQQAAMAHSHNIHLRCPILTATMNAPDSSSAMTSAAQATRAGLKLAA